MSAPGERPGSNAVGDTPYAVLNSLVVAFSTAVVNLVLGTFAAYSFSRIRFRGSQVLLIVYLLTRMVPGIAIIIPFYLVMGALDLVVVHYASQVISPAVPQVPLAQAFLSIGLYLNGRGAVRH